MERYFPLPGSFLVFRRFFQRPSGLFFASDTSCYVTADGGASWKRRPFRSDPDSFFAYFVQHVQFIDKDTVIGLTNPSRRMCTSFDGGATWTIGSLVPCEWITTFRFVNSRRGFAISLAFIATADGGISWDTLLQEQLLFTSNSRGSFTGMSLFKNGLYGCCVGTNGMIAYARPYSASNSEPTPIAGTDHNHEAAAGSARNAPGGMHEGRLFSVPGGNFVKIVNVLGTPIPVHSAKRGNRTMISARDVPPGVYYAVSGSSAIKRFIVVK